MSHQNLRNFDEDVDMKWEKAAQKLYVRGILRSWRTLVYQEVIFRIGPLSKLIKAM
jgi:hypothetical protein